jgi:pimeloyl-ACP methyl ester carboxylesterase
MMAAGIVCGMGPADAPGMADGVSWTIPGKPGLMRALVLSLTSMGLTRDPDRFLAQSKETLSEVDRRFLEQPAAVEAFVAGLQEAFRSGIGGANRDAALYRRPWGFRLEQITAPVHLWHGEQDANVPVSVGRHVAVAIPNCDARFYPEEGHLTLPYNRIKEILTALVAR